MQAMIIVDLKDYIEPEALLNMDDVEIENQYALTEEDLENIEKIKANHKETIEAISYGIAKYFGDFVTDVHYLLMKPTKVEIVDDCENDKPKLTLVPKKDKKKT